MKASRGIVVPMLAIIVGVAMMVGAVSMCLSKVEENDNIASDLPVVLSITPWDAPPETDLPNYENGMVMVVNQAYDMLLSYTTSINIIDSIIKVKFTKVGVTLTTDDVILTWCVVGDATSIDVDLEVVGDDLIGVVGDPLSLNVGDSAIEYYANLAYTSSGDYGFDLWVEGSLAP
jgi:hypothetical protein